MNYFKDAEFQSLKNYYVHRNLVKNTSVKFSSQNTN